MFVHLFLHRPLLKLLFSAFLSNEDLVNREELCHCILFRYYGPL